MQDLDQFEDLQIHSDLDYNSQEQQAQNRSPSSSQELQILTDNPQQQLEFIQRKYQKYKSLRKQFFARRGGEEKDEKERNSDISSFSGSSLSSLSENQKMQTASTLLANSAISQQSLSLLVDKFQVMSAGKEPITFKKIAALSKLDIVTVQDFYSIWKKDKTIQGRINTSQSNLVDKKGQEKITLLPTQKMLSKQRAKVIETMLTNNPYLTFNEIHLELNKMNHLRQIKYGKHKEISRTTITKLLNQGPFKQARLRVLPPNRNDPEIVQIRYQFCSAFLKIYQQKQKMFFLDQHNFQMFRASDCMWIRPDLQSKSLQSMQKDQFSLIAVFDLQGGAFFKITKEGREKYDDYNGYVSLIQQALLAHQNYDLNKIQHLETESERSPSQSRKFLVMDSAIIKDLSKLKTYRHLTRGKIIVLPQYSPQLNPIQSWFQQLRERVRQKTYSSSLELCQGIHSILNDYQNHDYSKFIIDAVEQIKRGYYRSRF